MSNDLYFEDLRPRKEVTNTYIRVCRRCGKMFRIKSSVGAGSRLLCPQCNPQKFPYIFMEFIKGDDV